MTAADRARLRRLAESNLSVPHLAESERTVLALLDALDRAEDERDEWHVSANSLTEALQGAAERHAAQHATIAELRGLLGEARCHLSTNAADLREMGYDDAEERNAVRRLAKRIDAALGGKEQG